MSSELIPNIQDAAIAEDGKQHEIKIEQLVGVEKLIQLVPANIGQELEESTGVKLEGKLDGLSGLLMDNNVKAIIKSVAGQETQSIIENAVQSIQKSNSMEGKNKVITTSIQKIQSSLKKSDLATNKSGPAIDLVMSLIKSRTDKL